MHAVVGELLAQPPRPVRIRLDGHHPQGTARERSRQRTCAGTDLDDKFTGKEPRLIDDLVGSGRIKKVLAEPAPPPVPVCPPPGGHGRTPWS